MSRLTRDQIIEAIRNTKIDRQELVVPELGGSIFVRGMSGKERDAFEEGMRIRSGKRMGQSDLRNFRAKLAAKVIVDEDGKRLFNDSDVDVDLLGRLQAGVLDRILKTCTDLSGKADEDIDALGEDSASEAASAGSASASLANSV